MTNLQAIDIDGNSHEVGSKDLAWSVHVYGIIIQDGEILLSPQHRDNGYDLPGGKVNLDESLETALLREVREETGIDVSITRQLAVRDNYFKVTFREPQEVWHSVMVYYLCKVIGGEISTAGLDEFEKQYAGKAQWLPLSRLDKIHPAASYDWRQIVHEATAG